MLKKEREKSIQWVKDWAKVYFQYPIYKTAILGNEIQNIDDQAKRQVVKTILDAKLSNMANPRKLAQTLRDQHFSEDGNLNRDWQRVAISEAANMHSAGFLNSMNTLNIGIDVFIKFKYR